MTGKFKITSECKDVFYSECMGFLLNSTNWAAKPVIKKKKTFDAKKLPEQLQHVFICGVKPPLHESWHTHKPLAKRSKSLSHPSYDMGRTCKGNATKKMPKY